MGATLGSPPVSRLALVIQPCPPGLSAETTPSRDCKTSAIQATEDEVVELAAPLPFAFLFAFSVPRSKHPRPADARSPSRDSSFQCGLLPRGRLVSPSTNLFHSPWEWAATAHPPGNVWSAARLQAKNSDEKKWSAAMYSAYGEAFASGHDVLRALLFLSSMSASSALPKGRLRAGPV